LSKAPYQSKAIKKIKNSDISIKEIRFKLINWIEDRLKVILLYNSTLNTSNLKIFK